MTVVTRFAPSPTGMLHIGGARTALFNYYYAKRHKGRFLLRIEDTDRERSTPEATAAILEAMDWLGLKPDEPPIFQFARAGRHAEVALEMIKRGTAFKCYATPEELQNRRDRGEAARQAAKAEGVSEAEKAAHLAEANALLAPYRSPWRDGAPPPAEDAPYTIRLRAPDDGERVLEDGVQGTVKIQAGELDDMVLLRADGTPVYMLAVVVDDHDMGVTHVIRGDDHLRNAFRQIPIYEAMGWQVPQFAHVPLIHGADGTKLSKRHGALSTLEYRTMGFLPEGMRAYLVRLGWSGGGDEVLDDDEIISLFDISGINKAPARLDLDKLKQVSGHFMKLASEDRLWTMAEPLLLATGPLSPAQITQFRAALPHLKMRASNLPELAASFAFLRASRPLELAQTAKKALTSEAVDRLEGLARRLDEVSSWTAVDISEAMRSYCAAQSLGMGQIGPPLRAALTGGLPAPDLAPVMEWLGKEETLARIADQVRTPQF